MFFFVLRFYRHSLFGRPSGGPIFRCTTKDRGERRAKGLQSRPLESGFFIRGFGGETCVGPTSSHWCNLRDLGPSRRRKLHILRFAFRGKSSVVPLLLLSPPNPLRWALAGPLLAAPLNPRGNVLGHSDVLCAYHLAMVRVTRLSRAWRAPHCFHALCVLRLN